MNLEEAINEYYRLEQKYNQEKNQLISSLVGEKKEKRRAFQRLPPPKCVGCQRTVGSIFTRQVIGEQTHLHVICGDATTPCTLLLDIGLPVIQDIEIVLKNTQDEIIQIKQEIIHIKNKLLFGYITEKQAIAQLENMSQTLIEKTKTFEYIYQTYFMQLEKRDTTDDMINLGQKIQTFQILVKEFRESSNIGKLENANDWLFNEIQPLVRQISEKHFAVREIINDPPNFILYTQIYLPQQKEFITTTGKVIHWHLPTNTHNKAVTKKHSINKNKTRKVHAHKL
jgi:hypothetical protein